MKDRAYPFRWRLGILASIGVALLSIIPQASFWRMRGNDWHGAFYSYHPDEYAYASYVQSLIQGRPRRNDPYTGAVDHPNAPLPESIFSIQFVPAYVMAVPARFFGFSSSTCFILLTPIIAIASGLVLFWLVGRITGDDRIGATAVPFVLCLGGLARGQFLVQLLGGANTPPIPFAFLRRYEPALPFPFFFLFCLILWITLSTKSRRVVYWSSFAASVTFAILVFSYYYLWTAAATVLVSLVILWVLFRPEGFRSALRSLALVSSLCALSLPPYFMLLSRRVATADPYIALEATRLPDLFRPVSLLCILILALLTWAARRQWIRRQDRAVLFTAALAMAPLLMFNQQVITARSLQPIHYEQFIANYVALLALLLTGALLVQRRALVRPKATGLLLSCLALTGLAWGVYEAKIASTSRVNRIVDEFMPVAFRLTSLAQRRTIISDGTPEVVLVIYPIFQPAAALPTVAPQSVLWAPHSFFFSGLTPADHKQRYFQQLYYSGAEPEKQHQYSYARILFRQVIFGWDRAIAGLNTNRRSITTEEEEAALQDYATYVAKFDRNHAAQPTLSFVVTSAISPPDLSRVDRWYERDAGERIGEFILYRLELRP